MLAAMLQVKATCTARIFWATLAIVQYQTWLKLYLKAVVTRLLAIIGCK